MARKKQNRSANRRTPPDSPSTPPPPPGSPVHAKSSARKPLVLFALSLIVALAAFFLWRGRSGSNLQTITAGGNSQDVILVTIDTLRADSVGFAGNTKVKTPFLDRLAGEGVVFENAHAHNVVTLASHANILTGLYPYQHGVRDNAGFKLDQGHRTIATMLKEKGFATGAFVGAFPVDARYGLNQGFDVYDDHYPTGSNRLDFIIAERPAADVLTPAVQWWKANAGRKRFMWIHLYDPHAPYRPSGRFAQEYFTAPYLGEVAAVDDALSSFLGPILAASPEIFLVVTADHGEALGDHGEATHGLFTYEATLKVPLIVHDPARQKARREARYVRHVDIVPTILESLSIAQPDGLPGSSLLKIDADRDSYFESLSASINRGWAPLVGMIHQRKKYIDLPIPELYDLPADPEEKSNQFAEDRRTVVRIRNLLKAAAPTKNASRNVSSEEGAKLLSLGYITGSAARKDYTVADDPKNLIDIDTKLHQVIEFYQIGQRERAVQVAREIVDQRPDMELAREIYSLVLQQTERTDAAIQTLRESIARGNASESTRRRLGLILSETGQAREAVEILKTFADSEDPEALNAYGIALADVGRVSDSVQQFQKVLTVDADNPIAYQNLGIVALRARQPERARGYLVKALERNPKLPLALNTLGVIEAEAGNAAAAIDLWTRAIDADPQLYDAMFNVAIVAGRAGRREEAVAALRRFIDNAPPQRYERDLQTARKMLAQLGG